MSEGYATKADTKENYVQLKENYYLLLGNFIGYLEGVLFWDVDRELVKRLEEKIKELKKL